MKGIAIPKGYSPLSAGLGLLWGFGGHMWAKENQGWEGPMWRGHSVLLRSVGRIPLAACWAHCQQLALRYQVGITLVFPGHC